MELAARCVCILIGRGLEAKLELAALPYSSYSERDPEPADVFPANDKQSPDRLMKIP